MHKQPEIVKLPDTVRGNYFLLITSDTCDYCSMAKNHVPKLVTEATVFYDDRKNHPDVTGVPTLRFIKDGKVAGEMKGFSINSVTSFIHYWSLVEGKVPKIAIVFTMFICSLIRMAIGLRYGDSLTADRKLRKYRSDICSGCSSRKGPVCTLCSCFVKAKTTILASACPVGKW